MDFDFKEIKTFLDEKADLYNRTQFIESDPVQIPHLFDRKEDIEISGFLAATISWGSRTQIIRNALKMMSLMDNSPYEFVLYHREEDLKRFKGVIHRTFDSTDFVCFIRALKHIYTGHSGLEGIFSSYQTDESLQPAVHTLKKIFFEAPHNPRTTKHISDPMKGSSAKRINMFLRWMVRKDNRGVDFGIWKSIPPSVLSVPLDVHTGSVARKLGILTRNQNDAKAVSELDTVLREFDRHDPVRYDYALFGLGIFEHF